MAKKYPLAMTEGSKKAVRSRPKKASLKKMKPSAFLEKSRPLQIGEGDRAIINEFKKQIESGDPMGPLKLYGDGSEDGRHRAKAAQELGLGSVPVVDYRDGRADGGPVMNVPTRLPIGGDTEAFFRRLALYSYAVAPLMPGRRGYAAGGDPEVEGSVTAAPDDVEAALNVARRVQLPPMDIAGAPPAATSRATLPPMDIGRPQPEWGSASDVVRHRLDTGEKQLPQYDREAVEAWKEGAKSLGHVAAYGVPVAGPALGAYDLAMAAKEIAPHEFREGVRKGDYLSTGAGLTSAALAALGAPGKAAKAAAAAGAVMMPEEARATMFGEAAKMSPQIRSALEAAKRALVSGAKPSETWMEHGWAPDPSGKMVSEISDAPARFIPEGLEKFRRGEGVSLGEILSHPELYERYPSSFTTRVNPFMRDVKERGEYNPIQDAIGSNIRLSDRDLLENLLHEHQHRVQHIERMSPGTSPDVFKGPEYHAEPLMDDIKSMQGAALLQEFINKDPSLSAFDAFERAQKAGLPIGPQPLKFIRMPYEDLKAGASDLQSKVDEIYATVPPAYEQYRRSLGEWSARMPGERLELTGPQRRWTYPYVENYPAIVRPPSSTVIENVRSPKWMRERDAALELARKLQQEPLPKRDSGGVVKALKTLGKLFPEGSGYKSVPGKPAVVALPEFGRVEARPVPEIERAASGYMQSIGRPGEHEVSSFAPFNPAFATKVGEAFERMKHDPADPAVRRAYDALIDETMAQYRAAKDTGIDFRFLKPGEADPYAASPALGYEDIVNRGRLVMFPTEQGFGSTGGLPADNPLLRRAGRVGDKENAVVNDAFRIVHDLYGHFGAGNPFFRAPGEERAFQLHSKMFSPEALPAATAETRGQNSWLNYGPYGERNRSALGADTVFAEQKIGRMPEWASAPVPDRDKDVDEYVRSLIGRAEGGEVEGYAGGGRLTGDSLKAALEMAEKFIAPTRRTVAPDESLLAMHQISPVMLPKIRDLGALPAPSIGIGKVEHDPLDFGAITLIGRPHMAIPSETNPIFGQDVWSPRVPPLYPLTPDQIAEFGGAKHALSTKEGFIPATPENIVAQMKKRPIIGGEYLTGKHDEADPELGYVISSLTPKFGSFEEMSAARDRLLPRTRANDQYVALHAEHEKLANALDRSRFNPGAGDDDPVQRLGRAILFEDQHKGSNFYDAFKTFYPGASDPQKEWFRQHVENIRNLPTSYFEAKPQRVVDFGEFGGAVVPQQKWNEVSPLLKQMGINKIMSYDQFGAMMSPPGYTHLEAIRDFPELSFKHGGRAGYKKGGGIFNILKKYVDPASKYISDWQWRPLPEVYRDVGASSVPEHVQNFGRYMSNISDKASTEGLDPEDLIKAYMITRSSIQREGRTPAKLASYGIPVRDPTADLVRPEGHMADFLTSPEGVRFLNEARKGDLSQDVVDAATRVMKPFGMSKTEPDAMDWARRNLVEQTPVVSDMVARARAGGADPAEWRDFTQGVKGIGPAKSGFLASLLGRGDIPTLDARQAILHTGMKNADVQGIMQKRAGHVGNEAVDRLAARQRAMGFALPEELDPFYQHLAHHTVWDAIGNERTTHQDIIDAMKPRAHGGRAGYDDGGLVDNALSFLSQFNPVGTAEAAPKPIVKALKSAAERAIEIASSPKFDREAFHSAVRQADADAIAAPSIITTGRDVLAKNPNIDPNISLSTAGVPFAEHSYEWSPTGLLLPKKEADLAGLVRDRALITPALGDISPAETVVKSVGGVDLPNPTFTHGGGPYQRSRHAMGPNPAAWASRDAEANKMYNKILENAQAEGRADSRFKDSPIVMSHTTMGYPSVDSTHIVRHNVLGQIDALHDAGKIDPNEVERFDAFMRKKLGENWPGMLNTNEVEKYLASNGAATSEFVQALDNKTRLRAGFPDVGAARFAAMHPKLMGADPMSSGYSMALMDPSRGTTGVWHGPSAETIHPTYGTRIPSLGYIGGTKYQVPFNLMFPDWASRQKSHFFEKKSGTLKPITPTMLQQSLMTQKPVQRATQEWLDNIMEYVEKAKKPWGWKRGGRTRIHL